MPVFNVVSDIALLFAGTDGFDRQLDKALAMLGQELQVSRCYLFIDSVDGNMTSNTHEWCAPGIEAQIDNLQCVPYDCIPSWKQLLVDKTLFAINDIATLPDDMRRFLEPQNVRSTIFAPLRIDGCLCGFFGFDECTGPRSWGSLETAILETVLGIISAAYAKKLMADNLKASEANFRSFFDTIDDIILIASPEGRIIQANEGAIHKLGYSQTDLQALHLLDLFPHDQRDQAAARFTAMLRRETLDSQLEIQAGNGLRLPVETRVGRGQWSGSDSIFLWAKDLTAEKAAQQKFEKLFRNSPAPMALRKQNDWRYLDVNDAFASKLGYTREEVVGRSSEQLGIIVDQAAWQQLIDELQTKGCIRARELDVRHKNGQILHGLFSADLIDVYGERYLLSLMIDITELLELKSMLLEKHTHLENIIDAARLGTWEWNVQTGETVFNERWAEMLGYRLDELLPTTLDTWERLTHPDDAPRMEALVVEEMRGHIEYFESEIRMQHKDGHWVWIAVHGKIIEYDEKGEPLKMYGTHIDISERKTMEEELRNIATRDPLTNVYNRRYIFERLTEIEAEYNRSERIFCVAILDIDHFKRVNDTWGHLAGDYVLKAFTDTIASIIRPYDLLGRYGGEEFIIVAPNTTADDMANLLERIMNTVRDITYHYNGNDIRFTFSAGFCSSAEFAQGMLSIETLVDNADKRLYVAKQTGRDRCVGPEPEPAAL